MLGFFFAASSALALGMFQRPVHDRLGSALMAHIWSSELLHAGDWPFWYPYTRYGFPLTTLHYLSYFWNPLALALGAVVRYDVWTMQLQDALMRLFGLVGAYGFARRHVESRAGAAAAAACYIGSGSVTPALASGVVFPGLMVTPWLALGLNLAATGDNRRSWLRAVGLVAIGMGGLILAGYPGTWLTAPVLLLPYVLALAPRSLPGQTRAVGAAAAGGLLGAGTVAMYLLETAGFSLYGAQARDDRPLGQGNLEFHSLLGFGLVNPSYTPGASPSSVFPLYLGLLPIVLLFVRCSPWAYALARPFRLPLMVAAALLVAAGVPLTSDMVSQALGAHSLAFPVATALHGEAALALGLLGLAWTAVNGPMLPWRRADAALLFCALMVTCVSLPTPLGNWLRASVPPFSLVRFNFLYMWVAALCMPVLAWRTLESLVSRLPLPDPNASPRRLIPAGTWMQAGVPVLLVVLATTAAVAAARGGPFARPDGPETERIGTVTLVWHATVLAAGIALTALVTSPRWRRSSRLPLLVGMAGGALLVVALAVGWPLHRNADVFGALTLLPRGGRLALDVAHLLAVLACAAIVLRRATTRREILLGLALVAVVDIGLATTRYMTDGTMLPSSQSPPTLRPHGGFLFTGTTRNPHEDSTLNFRLAIPQRPTLYRWPEIAPHVAAVDKALGEPTVFASLVYFPHTWRQVSPGEYAVTSEQLRLAGGLSTVGLSQPESAPAERGPVCATPAPGGAPTARANVTRMLSSTVSLEIATDCDRLLVYTDTWAPGWNALVGGRPVEVLKVNDAIRGVVVPSRARSLTWRYRPPRLPLALFVMAASWMLAVWLAGGGTARYPRTMLSVPWRRAGSHATSNVSSASR